MHSLKRCRERVKLTAAAFEDGKAVINVTHVERWPLLPKEARKASSNSATNS